MNRVVDTMTEAPASSNTSSCKEDSLLYQIDENREKHILQMDANALMVTLRELETAITAENDPKVVPAWGRSIIPRLEGLESKLTKAMKAAKASATAAAENIIFKINPTDKPIPISDKISMNRLKPSIF